LFESLRSFHFYCRRKVKPKSKSKETGSWLDGSRKAMIQLAGELFRKMGEDLDSIAKDYTSSLDAFITQLPMQQHVNLKFLLFRLDFTEYYSRVSSSK
jgi:gamma-tubulin complex component 3